MFKYQQYYYQLLLKMLTPALIVVTLLWTASTEIFNFDYSKHGDNWQSVWPHCGTDAQQSPIELSSTTTHNDSYLFVNFYPQKAIIYWYNTTVYIRTAAIATTSFGEVYSQTASGGLPALKATEVRIRAHAEHKFEGQGYYDLELQIFCTDLYGSPSNLKLAFGFMFEVGGEADPGLEGIMKNYQKWNGTTPYSGVNATLSFAHLLLNSEPFEYYFYQGSSTIPPCFGGALNWIIPKKAFSMSKDQRDFFYGLFNDGAAKVGNWRSLQSIKDNPVYFRQL